ncbi:hypothetical protein LTR84_006242 [Exophiala bonariae]|uniref:Transcription factor domain-containing protein n=1 Tax=Exophiala bonariae TaxID=1690606 RepID=A0AAV9N1Z2_9EURO|nr:hypothetical protein LTR84_006242 [Exophiala bonariae]
MSQVGRSRRKKPNFITVELELLTSDDVTEPSILRNDTQAMANSQESTIVPRALFPYGIYAVDPTPRARELIHFIHVEAEYLYRPFRREWFSMAVVDVSAYYISLANASLYMNRIKYQGSLEYSDCLESSDYYRTCLATMSKRLESNTERSSEGVITTILGFLCHDSNVSNWPRWAVHMNGLQQVLQLRDNSQTLSGQIAIFLSWMDIIGSAVSDTMPRFNLPVELKPVESQPHAASPYLQSVLSNLRSLNSVALNDVALCLEDASYVADIANSHAEEPLFWNNGINGTRLIGPLSHQLLSLPRVSETIPTFSNYRDEALREMTRLALLVVLARLKLAFIRIADELVPLQERFARMFLHTCSPYDEFSDLQLWALGIVGSMASQGPTRNLYLSQVHKWAALMQIKCGAKAFHLIRQINLIDDMMGPGVRALLIESICFDQRCCKEEHDPV